MHTDDATLIARIEQIYAQYEAGDITSDEATHLFRVEAACCDHGHQETLADASFELEEATL